MTSTLFARGVNSQGNNPLQSEITRMHPRLNDLASKIADFESNISAGAMIPA